MVSSVMRALALATVFSMAQPILSAPLYAQQADGAGGISAQIAADGLGSVEAKLSAISDPNPDALFALAGTRFLLGVEKALQLRWQTGLAADWSELPILRLPIPANPSPRALTGADLDALLAGLQGDLDNARAALSALGDQDFALEIDLADLWFDINANAARDPGEGLADVFRTAMGMRGAADQLATVRFDRADAAWLTAYSHLLSGVVATGQAYDLGATLEQVFADSAAMAALAGETPPDHAWDMMFGKQVDRLAVILRAMAVKPDTEKAKAVQAHFLEMVAHNRRFWELVGQETDNDREWIPNASQQSALGPTLPEGASAHWLALLDDAEKILQGKLLIPHWRYGVEAGINLDKLLQDPPALDLVGVVQGGALLPYAEKGPRASMQSWRDFEAMVWGDALLFALWLN